ncbi:MAG: hypothetical protein PHF00_06910 [Elusimicrobia bacterium]|nr:hypothetical protein [Elusimicrobiota bacterium]
MTAGFALAELVIAAGLFSMVAAGLLAFQSMVLGGRGRTLAVSALGNNVTMVRRAFAATLRGSSYVAQPGAGAVSAVLTVLSNCADDGVSPLAAGPIAFAHICAESGGEKIYLYQGQAPVPEIRCGEEGGADVARTLVAGGGGFSVRTIGFSRPSDNPALVRLDLQLALEAAGLREERSLALQGGVNRAMAD